MYKSMMSETFNEQFKIYFGKCRRDFFNSKRWSTIICAVMITLLLMLVTGSGMLARPGFGNYDTFDTMRGSYALVCACIWIGLFNSIQSICKERAILKNEYHGNLIPEAYILAHAAFEAILCFFDTIAVSIIVFVRYAHNTKGVFCCIGLFITFFLVIFAADMMGIAVSSLVIKPDHAMTAMPFILIIQLIFTGEMFNLNKFTSFLANFTVSKWGWESILTLCDVEGRGVYEWLDWSQEYVYAHFLTGWFFMIVIALVCGILASQFIKLTKFDKR